MDPELQETRQRDQIERIQKIIKDVNEEKALQLLSKLHTLNLTQEFHLRPTEDKTEIKNEALRNARHEVS